MEIPQWYIDQLRNALNDILMSYVETNDPENVIQETKAFKSKYLSTNQ